MTVSPNDTWERDGVHYKPNFKTKNLEKPMFFLQSSVTWRKKRLYVRSVKKCHVLLEWTLTKKERNWKAAIFKSILIILLLFPSFM